MNARTRDACDIAHVDDTANCVQFDFTRRACHVECAVNHLHPHVRRGGNRHFPIGLGKRVLATALRLYAHLDTSARTATQERRVLTHGAADFDGVALPDANADTTCGNEDAHRHVGIHRKRVNKRQRLFLRCRLRVNRCAYTR